ncbi:MAG: hypothetical protein MSA26_00075 [Lachnospiraceae bacterium]|nr:hypothetical protein [Lachnospiraceae bacterium]
MFIELNKSEAKKYGKELYRKWITKLTKSEIKSLKKYKLSSKKINNDARNNIKNIDVDNISKALKKATIDKNITVYREAHIKLLESNNTTIQKVSVGDVLIETGFMSSFLYRPKRIFKGKVRLKINVPVGTYGAYINEILFIYKWERELLFDRGTVLKVIGKSFDKGILLLEVVCINDNNSAEF